MGRFTTRTKISLCAGVLLVVGTIALQLSRPVQLPVPPPVKLTFVAYTNQGRTVILSLTNGLESELLLAGTINVSCSATVKPRSSRVLHVNLLRPGGPSSTVPRKVELQCYRFPSRSRQLMLMIRQTAGLTNPSLNFTVSADLPPVSPLAEPLGP